MSKYTKRELSYNLEFDSRHQQKVGLPNDIFQILSTDKELMSAKSPHVAYAYSFLYLVSWLYKYAKYNLPFEMTDIRTLKEIIGLSPINKKVDYIFKKNGVLDRLGITRTVSFKDAPVQYEFDDGFFIGYVTYEEWIRSQDARDIEDNKRIGIIYNPKRKQIKYPIFGEDNRIIDGEEYEGTFYDWSHSHTVPFDVFLECMVNDNLGTVSFYIYAYLYSRCGLNNGLIEVSLDKITAITGIRPTSRDIALDALKKYGLIKCYPADYVIGKGDIKTGASVYEVVETKHLFNTVPRPYIKRNVMYKEQYEKKEGFLKKIADADY